MSIFDKPIGRFIFQAADNSEYGSLVWDTSASISVDAGTGVATVFHNGNKYTFKATFTPPPKPVPVANVLTCTVGPGMDYPHLGDAFVAARDQNATDLHISILPVPENPDYYINTEQKTTPSTVTGRGFYGTFDQNTIIDSIPMFGSDGKRLLPRLGITDAANLYYRKAILIPYGNLTVRGIEFDGSANGSGNSYSLAPIRPEPTARAQTILVEDCHMHHWANGGGLGTFGTYQDDQGNWQHTPGCTWTERRNYVHDTGTGAGTEHGIYVARIDNFISENCLYVGCREGHLSKSRALRREIRDCIFADDENSTSSYGVDIPEGAVFIMERSTILRGPNAHNGSAIAFGEEVITPLHPNAFAKDDNRSRSITLTDNTILSQTPPNTAFGGTLGLWNDTNSPITATGTKFFGLGEHLTQMNNGSAIVPWPGDVTMLTAMPNLNMTPPMFSS